jgi:hypothetical protein
LYRSHKSWLQNDSIRNLRNESGFVLYRGLQILNVFKIFVSWICFVDWFLKDSTCFHESNESLVHRPTLNKPRFANPYWFQKIGFVDSFRRSFLKVSFCGFVLWICFWKIGFVDLLRESKNPKLLDLFCFGRIPIRIPHPCILPMCTKACGGLG